VNTNRLVTFSLLLAFAATPALATTRAARFGPLQNDPGAIIDLPAGFRYTVVSRAGDPMHDGLRVPPLCDDMGAFPGPNGTTIVVRNHETFFPAHGPFGTDRALMAKIPSGKFFDLGRGVTPCPGGTTTFVWDTKSGKMLRQFLSLVGTLRNCSGTETPWGSWLTCEENVYRAGDHAKEGLTLQQDHGWLFDVPATAEPAIADPVPLKALGRRYHEGAAFDTRSGVLYMTEDLHDGLVYRFVPETRGNLHTGRLQALALMNLRTDTRNGETSGPPIQPGEKLAVRWIDLDNVEAPLDDMRIRGHKLGAALFSRGEGMIEHKGSIYFTCTSGGIRGDGQVWRYTPSPHEGTPREGEARGILELVVEPNDAHHLNYPDNLTITPWNELMVCEDPGTRSQVMRTPWYHLLKVDGPKPNARLVLVSFDRATHVFAVARVPSEFAGAVFSPDGSTLFVNLQIAGVTLAITGPWPAP